MTSAELTRFETRTLRALRAMPSAQRAAIVRRILESDPELAPVLPQLLATCAQARYVRDLARPLMRDSVS